LDENEVFPLSVEPFRVELAKELGADGTAFVEDTAGKRYRATFRVGTMPQDVINKTFSNEK